MLTKTLLDQALKRIKVGSLKLTYWTGETVTYGQGKLYAHITIKRPKAVRAIVLNPTLGFGESYMNGDIEVEGDLREVPRFASDNRRAMQQLAKLRPLVRRQRNRNRRSRQADQVQSHYDRGNDFYKLWLDDSMTYSCAYFKTPKDSLELAQQQKVDHILRKLQLKPGLRLLDIGSGWGQLLIRAAQEYGVTGHGITLSREQFQFCVARVKELGLQDQLTFELVNYQDLAEREVQFERIVSVGMFEHVGMKNHDSYFRAVNKLLTADGLTVLHTISTQRPEGIDPWIDRYIFPGGYIPAVSEIDRWWPKYDWQFLDYENLRIHYAMTLHEWSRRFEEHKDEIIKRSGERFYRMWRLYLAGSEAGFRWGDLGLSQFVFSKSLNNDLPLTRDFLYR